MKTVDQAITAAAEPVAGNPRRAVLPVALPLALLSAAMPLAVADGLMGAMALAAGLALLWSSPIWRRKEKATTTAAALAAPVLITGAGTWWAFGSVRPDLGLVAADYLRDHLDAWIVTGVLMTAVLVPAVACLRLYRASRDRI